MKVFEKLLVEVLVHMLGPMGYYRACSMGRCRHLVKVAVILFEPDRKSAKSVHSQLGQLLPMLVAIECVVVVAKLIAFLDLAAEKRLVVVELAMILKCVGMALKVSVVPKLPRKGGLLRLNWRWLLSVLNWHRGHLLSWDCR